MADWVSLWTHPVLLLKWLARKSPPVSLICDWLFSVPSHSTSVALGTKGAFLALPLLLEARVGVRGQGWENLREKLWSPVLISSTRRTAWWGSPHLAPGVWVDSKHRIYCVWLSLLVSLRCSFCFSFKGSVIWGKDCAFHSERRYFWKTREEFGWWWHVFFTSLCEGGG